MTTDRQSAATIEPESNQASEGTRADENGQERFAPAGKRAGVALCLSGGGFRAALFHLGALRRLNETGILPQISTISSVSGGSIIAAHLAHHLSAPPPLRVSADWEEEVAAPFRRFTARNLRTGPILRRLLPWQWLNASAGVEGLAARYEKDLTDLRLKDLPDRPYFIFCATDMAYGVNWVFEKNRTGDFQAGYASPPPDWPVARAVAASSCFPPVFNPLPIELRPDQLRKGKAPQGEARDSCIAGLRLTDGGNYDNMGLEPVWKNHHFILVSDGGATFDFTGDNGLRWRLLRYTDIVSKQAAALRKRWLISGFRAGTLKGSYWGIGSVVKHYEAQTQISYTERLVDECIAEVRTDMDAFSEGEIAVLENHGYLVADAAIRTHLLELAPAPPPLKVPHPDWMDEGRVKAALEKSNKRSKFGRR